MRPALFAIAISLGFAVGFHAAYTRNALFQLIVDIKRAAPGQDAVSRFNRLDQLVGYAKREVPCPRQTNRTMVAFVFGQSNAANALGQRYAGRPNVINFFDGKCFEASDPLLGNGYGSGSQWVLTANLIAERHDNVVIVPAAVGNTKIREWLSGPIAEMVQQRLATVGPYEVTHFLWHQGESDADTPSESYAAALRALIANVRGRFPNAHFYVSIASHCFEKKRSESVRRAQMSVVDPGRHIYQGPDTDMFTAIEDRMDDCHFSGPGQQKIAKEWSRVLK
jgi:hypothetical protein